MKDIRLTEEAKKILVNEYGKDSVKIDKELNELSKLVIKRKNCIQDINKGNSRGRQAYVQVTEDIKKIINQINIILSA